MKKFTIPEFAAKIRNKYPNSYDDLQDKELVQLWVKKYPADNEFINYGSNNWFTYIGILAIIVGVFYFYDSTKSESIDDIQIEYPDDSNRNEEPEIYDDPIYDSDIQGNGIQDEPINNSTPSKEWVNCRNCHGRGEIVCDECNGTTLMFCGTCNGRGTFTTSNGTDICYYCKGALKVRCSQCHGKGIEGRCYVCGGSGQIQE